MFGPCLQDILEWFNLRKFLAIYDFDIVGSTSRSDYTIDRDVRREMLKATSLREVEMEHYFVAAVRLQGQILALDILGMLEGNRTFRHLVQ